MFQQGKTKKSAFFSAALFVSVAGSSFISMTHADATEVCSPTHRKGTAGMKRAIRPTWSGAWSKKIGANDSYLTSTDFIREERTLNDEIFVPHSNSNELERQAQNDENSKVRGTQNGFEEKSRLERIRDYAKRAIDKISKFQLKNRFNHAKDYAERMDSPAREPLAAAVIATSLYTGRTFNFRLTDDLRISSRTELKDRHASVALPLPGLVTPKVETNKGTGVTASVSRQLTDQISAEVGTKDRGTAQVNYSLSF